MFSFHNNLLPKSLLSTFTLDIKKNSDFHSYNTRSSSHYRSQYARINTRLFSFVCTGPILWNRLPSTLKDTYTLASFKRNLKTISQCLIIGRISLFAGTKLILHSTVSCFCLFPYSYKTLLFYPMILFVPRLPIFSGILHFGREVEGVSNLRGLFFTRLC